MIGLKKIAAEEAELFSVWRPTDDLEDAALPPGEFVLCATPDVAYSRLSEMFPGDEETFFVDSRMGDDSPRILVWKRPILLARCFDTLKYPARYRPPRRAAQWATITRLVADRGTVLIPVGYDHVRGWAGFADAGIAAEKGAYTGPTVKDWCYVAIVTAAPPEALAKREAIRRGAAKRAANRKAKEDAAKAREARVGGLRAAVRDLRKALREEVEAACERAGAGEALLMRYEPPIRQAAALFRAVVGKDPRRLAAYKATIAAAREHAGSPEDLAAGVPKSFTDSEGDDLAWLAEELGRRRGKKTEAAPAGAGT